MRDDTGKRSADGATRGAPTLAPLLARTRSLHHSLSPSRSLTVFVCIGPWDPAWDIDKALPSDSSWAHFNQRRMAIGDQIITYTDEMSGPSQDQIAKWRLQMWEQQAIGAAAGLKRHNLELQDLLECADTEIAAKTQRIRELESQLQRHAPDAGQRAAREEEDQRRLEQEERMQRRLSSAVKVMSLPQDRQPVLIMGVIEIDDEGWPTAGSGRYKIGPQLKQSDPDGAWLRQRIAPRVQQLVQQRSMQQQEAMRTATRELWASCACPATLNLQRQSSVGTKSTTARLHKHADWQPDSVLMVVGPDRQLRFPVAVESVVKRTLGAVDDDVLGREGLPQGPLGKVLLRRIVTMYYEKDLQRAWAGNDLEMTFLSFQRLK